MAFGTRSLLAASLLVQAGLAALVADDRAEAPLVDAGAVAVKEAGETTMLLGLPMWWSYVSLAPGATLEIESPIINPLHSPRLASSESKP